MADQHRATNSEWACIKPGVAAYSCILELLHRVEALEAAADRAESEAFRAASTEIRPSEVAERIRAAAGMQTEPSENLGFGQTLVDPPVYAEAKPNHPEIPDSPPLCVRCWAAAAARTRAKPNHPENPGGSLLERVACADGPADAICEVAAWLREHYGGPTATSDLLEREVER